MVNVASERKEVVWREILGAKDEIAKERYMEVYKEGKRKVKMCIYQNKTEVNE